MLALNKKWILFILIIIGLSGLQAQEDSTRHRRVEINGYIKNLQTLLFFNESYPDLQQFRLVDTFLQDNLMHNRFNLTWHLAPRWNFRADVRSRVFFGDLVRATPNYADLVKNANDDYFKFSLVAFDNQSFVVHTMLDRLYLEYTDDTWEIRAGRQRINWGINTVWNPNDIFNAFAFTDFDYEERPGSDAIRVKRHLGYASSVEVAVRAFDHWEEAVAAALWKFNRGTYDLQVLAGVAQNDLVLGGGWAGNLKNAGFKGEATWFYPLSADGRASFAATLGLDYVFDNALYLNSGYLYNSNGASRGDITGLFNFNLSAKNLYPYRHAVFGQVSYPFSPLLNGGIALIYSPVAAHALFANPTLTVSVASNWDLDFIGQLVFNQNADQYVSPIQALFLRLKLSY